jgi:nitrogen fixation NifU-like protein
MAMEPADAFAALYRDTVLDHGRRPRHAGTLPPPARSASASNALCGDRIELDVALDDRGAVAELRHRTQGCLICTASASLMAGDVRGRDAGAVAARLAGLRHGLQCGDGDGLGELAALTGVSAHPSRHRCALLPWEALQAAMAARESA